MRAFITPGRDVSRPATQWGDTVYTLVAEDGEVLCSHMCSHWGFAPGDLYAHRPERAAMFAEKGIDEFLWIDEASDIDEAELRRRNHAREASA
jgi:hypothetical protein